MTRIILTEEQMNVVRHATTRVQVCDPHGVVLGMVDPEITPEFIAEHKRRAATIGPRYSSEQVRNHLRGLQEAWDREGGFDEARMWEILKGLREADKR